MARYRHRGRVYDEWRYSASPSMGIVALFAGQSGTGKTLAAEWGPHQIRCNVLAPTVFRSELTAWMYADDDSNRTGLTALMIFIHQDAAMLAR